LFLWGEQDSIVPAAFARHVRKWLPTAEQVVIDACGHVPQVEQPERTHELLTRFFAKADETALSKPSVEPARRARAA
jgi:pimeloyl-ACP methyl ester carboxylesterase